MRKLNVGDYALIGGPGGRMPAVRPQWLHRGVQRKVVRVIGAPHQGHCFYILAGRGGRGGSEGLVVRGDEVRAAPPRFAPQKRAHALNRTTARMRSSRERNY